MTALKTLQQTALDNLAALLTEATTGLRRVHVDPVDALNELPALEVHDQGILEQRAGQWRELLWDIELIGYVQLGKLELALDKVRDVRADVIDQLGTDITLGGAISNSLWQEPMRVVGLEKGTVQYVGFRGLYRLVIRENRSFA